MELTAESMRRILIQEARGKLCAAQELFLEFNPKTKEYADKEQYDTIQKIIDIIDEDLA